jgi:excisionase family DNA binding protein
VSAIAFYPYRSISQEATTLSCADDRPSPTMSHLRDRASEVMWTAEDVSEYLRIPVGTLYQWRHRRIGPPAAKVGRHLRYDSTKVRAWLTKQECNHGS